MLVALEQGEVSSQLHDGRQFAVFLENLADRFSYGGGYRKHVDIIGGSGPGVIISRRARCPVVCSAQRRTDCSMD